MVSPALAEVPSVPGFPIPPRIVLARLGTGFLQGLLLYLLYQSAQAKAWPATEPLLFVPLLLTGLLAPVIFINSLGHMPRRTLWLWTGTAAALVFCLGLYDVWRMGAEVVTDNDTNLPLPSPQLFPFLVAGLFIAHALVLAAVREGRRIARYPTYFDVAWTLAVQLVFCAMFIGATWVVLLLGAELFQLVKLDFLRELIRQPWFAIPVTVFAFACALHMTDVRPAVVRGVRTLLLTLMSWILPVFTLLVGAFLASLLFTGMAPLWATRHAAAVLLGASALLVVLINAAWQDGTAPVARAVRASARIAALLLAPMVLLAGWGLALRVGEHGWTSERIIAAACVLVAGCYAGGYAAAALRKGWLDLVAAVNTATAFVVLAVLLLLFSPLGDPARLSVNDQLDRLASGEVSASQFDFAYLRFDGARYGREALARLEAKASGPDAALIRERIAAVRKIRHRWQAEATVQPAVVAANVRAWPAGVRLPESFLAMDWATVDAPLPECLRLRGIECDAALLDISGDGKAEIVLLGNGPDGLILQETAQGRWELAASLPMRATMCPPLREALRRGELRAVAPRLQDIEIGGQRVTPRAQPGQPLACGEAPPAPR